MRRKAAKELQMVSTTTPDEGRPVPVKITADVGRYVRAMREVEWHHFGDGHDHGEEPRS